MTRGDPLRRGLARKRWYKNATQRFVTDILVATSHVCESGSAISRGVRSRGLPSQAWCRLFNLGTRGLDTRVTFAMCLESVSPVLEFTLGTDASRSHVVALAMQDAARGVEEPGGFRSTPARRLQRVQNTAYKSSLCQRPPMSSHVDSFGRPNTFISRNRQRHVTVTSQSARGRRNTPPRVLRSSRGADDSSRGCRISFRQAVFVRTTRSTPQLSTCNSASTLSTDLR